MNNTMIIEPDYSMHKGVKKPIFKDNLLKDNAIHKAMKFFRKEKENIILLSLIFLLLSLIAWLGGV